MSNDFLGSQPLTVDNLPEPHKAPPLEPGDRVVLWPHPSALNNRHQKFFGFVAQVESPQTCHIIVAVEGQWEWRESCVHKDDWQVKLRPARFEDNTSGIYDLAESEKQQRAVAKRLDEIDEKLAILQVQLRSRAPKPVEQQVESPDKPSVESPPKRKRKGKSGPKQIHKTGQAETPEPAS